MQKTTKILWYLFVLEIILLTLFLVGFLNKNIPSNLQSLLENTYVVILGILLIITSILNIFLSIKFIQSSASILLSILLLLLSALAIFSPVVLFTIKTSQLYKEKQSADLRTAEIQKIEKANINELKDIYKNANQDFSKLVTVSSYQTKYIDDIKEILIIQYQESPFATYISEGWSGTFNAPNYSQETLKNLIGKKVAVLVPPFDYFTRTYSSSEKKADNKAMFYAKTEFDGNDLEWSLGAHSPVTAEKVLTKKVDISPKSNLDNLKYLDYWKDISGNQLQNYTEARYKELCDFFSEPKEVMKIGVLGSNSNSFSDGTLYATFSEQPKIRVIFSTMGTVLQSKGINSGTQVEIDSVILWLNKLFKEQRLKMKVNICSTAEPYQGFLDALIYRSIFGNTIYGQTTFPMIENIGANVATVDSNGKEDPTISGSGINYMYTDYKNKLKQ